VNHPVLLTDRLILRPAHPDDAADLFPMYSDPVTMRFDPQPPHPSPQFTSDHLARETGYPGSAYWTILLQSSRAPVGLAGFLGGSAVPGLGYILKRDFWGQGLTAEACRAILDYGFSELNYDRVELWIEPDNTRSLRVAAKLGALPRSSLYARYRHRPDDHFMLVYGLTAQEWRGDRPAAAPVRLFRSQPVFYVRSVMDSVSFYRDRLGFSVEFLYRETPDAQPVHAGVARGDWSGSRVVIQLSQNRDDRPRDPAGYLYVFMNHQMDLFYRQCLEQGVEILSSPQDYSWGLREFAVRDPDGHVLRFGTQS